MDDLKLYGISENEIGKSENEIKGLVCSVGVYSQN